MDSNVSLMWDVTRRTIISSGKYEGHTVGWVIDHDDKWLKRILNVKTSNRRYVKRIQDTFWDTGMCPNTFQMSCDCCKPGKVVCRAILNRKVKSGKYKGQTLEVVIKDEKYIRKLCSKVRVTDPVLSYVVEHFNPNAFRY